MRILKKDKETIMLLRDGKEDAEILPEKETEMKAKNKNREKKRLPSITFVLPHFSSHLLSS